MSYLYRCTYCRARRALKRLHNNYVRPPKCWSCGRLLTYRDHWQEKRNKKTTYKCDGYSYHHREGGVFGVVTQRSIQQKRIIKIGMHDVDGYGVIRYTFLVLALLWVDWRYKQSYERRKKARWYDG